MKSVAIFALTARGRDLAVQIRQCYPGAELHYCPKPFAPTLQGAFSEGKRIVFVGATGIVVRTLAPVITDKYRDPAVLVLDEAGQFVVPLLSGHEGGANQWGAELAKLLHAQLVLTTAKPYLQPVYTVGMGCERHCPAEVLHDLLIECLAKVALDKADIHSLSSIDIKSDEVGLIQLAEQLHVPYHTWSAQQLGAMHDKLSTRSDYVFRTVGVYGVAESAALYSAQHACADTPELILNKHKNARATCAIARAYPPSPRTETP